MPRRSRAISPAVSSVRSGPMPTPSAGSSVSGTAPGAQASRSARSRAPASSPAVRASTASRTETGSAPHQGGVLAHHLGDEEGVPAREPVEVGGVDVARPHQRRHRRHRQRVELDARRRRRARDVPEQGAQRRLGVRLVRPVGGQDQRAGAGDPAQQEAQQVDGRLVGPLQVVDDEQHGAGGERVEERAVDLVRRRPGAQQARGGLAEVVGDVVQRAEGTGHAQRVAHAPQHVADVRAGGEQAGPARSSRSPTRPRAGRSTLRRPAPPATRGPGDAARRRARAAPPLSRYVIKVTGGTSRSA